jgi:GDPmannose 4,6-dehydratase
LTATHTERRALVTGLTGQDGSFLAEFLLDHGYEVIGLIRRPPQDPLGWAEHLRHRITLIHGDLLDPESLTRAVAGTRPDELYHLASPSFIPQSWVDPARTINAIAGATATLLTAIRDHSPHTKIAVAASAAMFGATATSPQTEDSPCRPHTPYGTAKLAAHQLTGQFRAHDGLFACSAILYNHESERRPESFVTRKLSRAAAAVQLGLADYVELGDIASVRDWCFAGDVVRGLYLMLQREQPDDYILASGRGRTVAEVAQLAFATVGLNADDHIRVDSAGLTRAPDPTPPVGDPTKALHALKWRAEMSFEELIERMVRSDLEALQAPAQKR